MNIAIILAGGRGSRMHAEMLPKQYMEVQGKPIISYCLATFQAHLQVDTICIVAEEEWYPLLQDILEQEHIDKCRIFAKSGRTRQHSIYNGLREIKQYMKEEDIVIIHDAARPRVSARIIGNCIDAAKRAEGAMPVIPIKDTLYLSKSGEKIDNLLNRDEVFAGQAPESYKFGKYYSIHEKMSDQEMEETKGSSEAAYRYNMQLELIEGSEDNYKITTMRDLELFCQSLGKK